MKDEEIRLRVTKDFKDEIKAEADKRNINVSMLVRNCCLEVLKKKELSDDMSNELRAIIRDNLKDLTSNDRLRETVTENMLKQIILIIEKG